MWSSWFYQTIGKAANFILSINRLIGQSLALNFFKSIHSASTIGHFAAIVAMVKLREIQRQMLFTDVMQTGQFLVL
jgi:hypothetical protein